MAKKGSQQADAPEATESGAVDGQESLETLPEEASTASAPAATQPMAAPLKPSRPRPVAIPLTDSERGLVSPRKRVAYVSPGGKLLVHLYPGEDDVEAARLKKLGYEKVPDGGA